MEAYDDSLVAAFETALKNSFSSLRTTYNEQFYYYAFIFDSGLYPYISAWSYEALEKSIIENNIDDQERAWWKWDCICEKKCKSWKGGIAEAVSAGTAV